MSRQMVTMEQYDKIYLYRRIVKAKLFIDERFTEAIDLNNIADQAHFSKFHFIRLFKSIYGLTPKGYLISKRINAAMKHLVEGFTVTETCLMVGWESPTSFAGMFKKMTGRTPSNFQHGENERRKAIEILPLKFVPNCYAESHGWTNSNFEEV